MDNDNLIGEMDATVWASHWLETISEHPRVPYDKETMIGWFANAIMAGYDQGRHMEQKRDISEKFREMMFQAAGAATVPLLQDHPNYVFPADRVKVAVEAVCSEFGIPNA